MTFTVAVPKGAVVPAPTPILEERFNLASAFRVTPATGGISGGLLLLLAVLVGLLVWKFGRDRRYAGSPVDAAYGTDGGAEVARAGPRGGDAGGVRTPRRAAPG